MKKRLAIVAALALPMMAYSLPTIAEDKPAGTSDEAHQAMMKECKNDDKAKMDECMKKMKADHQKDMSKEGKSAGDAAKPADKPSQ
jgi:invasion protein IalB